MLWIGLLLYVVQRNWAEKRRLTKTVTDKTQQLQLRNTELEREIRQRQETESSLRASESRLNEAQRIANLGSWEWDLATNRLSWSNQLHHIFGVTPGTPLSYAEFLNRIHSDDRDRVRQRIATAEHVFENEYRIIRPDGMVRHLHGCGTIRRDDTGRLIRMAGVARDVTDQKNAELALRNSERKNDILMEHAGDGISICDLDGRLLDANRRLLELLGYTREELRALHAWDIAIPKEKEKIKQKFAEIAVKGRSLTTKTLLRKDGSTFPVEIAGATLEWEGRTVVLNIFRDISERKRLEAVLYRYQNDLEDLVDRRTEDLLVANRELEAFSYSVSHDLRGPLRAINGFSQILEEDYGERLDAAGHRYIDKICNATERMGRLIDDLLQLSRTVRTDLQCDPVNLSAMVEEISKELRAFEPERRARFRIQSNIQANADKALIQSLLDNLLHNAWKFTREQGQTVIEFGATEIDGESVFFVKDNGIGIDKSEASGLFQPFHRLHGPNEYEGSGIGLATVQRIAQRHGGEVWFESKPDQGATFFFSLGRKRAAPSIPLVAKWVK
ncbi:sensor histidine kinase [Thiohalomonas denitrificans]|uniref:histidine kinase n=1 Tax=Thiohalomonas denitrificans TaxID=415747 RepID=A0A1G5QXQ2_9GAMM|nr:PAS domain S-box protein [Thiohalomonas denitrificans]SCZ66378.1 PAS domain S-box-containing protein [Thiohalomonas denitrificans]